MMTSDPFMKRVAAFIVLIFSVGVARAAFVNPDAERQFVVMAGAFESGKYESAIAESRNFLSQFPRHLPTPATGSKSSR